MHFRSQSHLQMETHLRDCRTFPLSTREKVIVYRVTIFLAKAGSSLRNKQQTVLTLFVSAA